MSETCMECYFRDLCEQHNNDPYWKDYQKDATSDGNPKECEHYKSYLESCAEGARNPD